MNAKAHLRVKTLCVLCDTVELRESQHVLLTARPVEYPQCERWQCSKDLKHTKVKNYCEHVIKVMYIIHIIQNLKMFFLSSFA